MAEFKKTVQDVLFPLPKKDVERIQEAQELHERVLEIVKKSEGRPPKEKLIPLYNQIGEFLRTISEQEPRLHIFSYTQKKEYHGMISRIISKLRHIHTRNSEFTYYTQRAFEFLFTFGFQENIMHQKNYLEIETPVDIPVRNFAIHKLPDLDEQLHNTVVCVMLRGALLPSLIIAKEIEEYSSIGYVPEFALFRIARNDEKEANDMEYVLRENASFLNFEALDGKDLIFPDPMNATGGSILTVLEYLKERGIQPRSVKLFHVISALKGALQVIRSEHNIELYTLWVDPALNEKAYILPGLGDAGDRLNGSDQHKSPRNVLQLIAHYGQNIHQLYRAQIAKIEETILGRI